MKGVAKTKPRHLTPPFTPEQTAQEDRDEAAYALSLTLQLPLDAVPLPAQVLAIDLEYRPLEGDIWISEERWTALVRAARRALKGATP